MDLIKQYEDIIHRTQLKLLKLSKDGKHNSEIAKVYRSMIEDLEMKIKWCQKYGYPYTDMEFCHESCLDENCKKEHYSD